MFTTVLKRVLGTSHEREVKRMRPRVAAMNDLEPQMKALSDEGLRRKTVEFREQLENGATVEDLLIPAFAVCREAAVRSLGMRHYDVQLIGGIVLHQGKIAEMKTGEGKTLVATLPCYLNGLEANGVHVVTVNDYLAKRDADWMGKVHSFLGLTTGVIYNSQNNAQKKRAYRCDITYGQNNEFGFDYLRDNMKFSIFDYAQRPDLNFAIVDEVDSILVDEARTPLIISGPGETASEKYKAINEIIPRLRRDDHYELDEKNRSVTLTEDGIELAQRLLLQRGLLETENLYDPVNLQTLHILQQALRSHALYKRDQHYMVTPDGKVLIIDEFTGRTLPGRRWSDGLHQAVEAKEHVPIQDENVTLATISFQNLFRLYKKLSGMTGTADTEAAEFHKTYKLDVVVIPTNVAIDRTDHEDVVYKTEREKFNAIAEEIVDCHTRGQPVLVGTTSVEKSEALARILDRNGIKHNVLNAKQHEREAYVVAQAGRKGAVTVATNMAGRGTDILLGGNPEMLARMDALDELHALRTAREQAAAAVEEDEDGNEVEREPEIDVDADKLIAERVPAYRERCAQEKKEVIAAGGLHILGTERHESRRIDNQLRGRSGRQGDPGTSRFFLSLEDDLMRIFAGDRIQTMMDRLGMEEGVPIEHRWVTKAVENAQKKVEERNFDIRKNLLEYDDVMNQQRKSIYTLRRQILMGQYRTVPTDDQKAKGIKPEPVVSEVNESLRERARPILEQILQHHSVAPPLNTAPEEEIASYREAVARARETPIERLKSIDARAVERDVYLWFGCQVPVIKHRDEPMKAFDVMIDQVGMSLTEQHERLLDLVDRMIGDMVEKACPPNKHFEDWDYEGLSAAYEEQFGLEGTGIRAHSDAAELARKLYADAEAVLLNKSEQFGPESFLRLFRNLYMQDIDRQWIEHLQAMDHLRDGIGLRGYGQRDPKREYKREGYDLFQQMMTSISGAVAHHMFRARLREEDIERLEAQRRRQAEARLRSMSASHAEARAEAAGAQAPEGAGDGGPNRRQRRMARRGGGLKPGDPMPAVGAPAKPETVRRDRPKVGRNDPCWCGSGKKYKACHLREDQAAQPNIE